MKKKVAVIGAGIAGTTTAYSLAKQGMDCLLYTSPSPRDPSISRMPSSA